MYCKKSGLKIPNTPPPTLWKSSIHAGSAHITCRKTVRMCSTWRLIHFASSPTRSLTFGRWAAASGRYNHCSGSASSSLISGSIRVTSACRVTSAFRNWSNQARNCTSSGFLTFASNAAPTMTFCAVSRLRLFASGAVIWPQLRQSSVRVFCSFRDSVRGEKSHFSASLVV